MTEPELRAVAALTMDGEIPMEEAERLASVLAKANVLRADHQIESLRLEETVGEDPFVEIRFESGKRVAGRITKDIVSFPAHRDPFFGL